MSKNESKYIFETGIAPQRNSGRVKPEVDEFIEQVFKLGPKKNESIFLNVKHFSEKEAANLINTSRRRYMRKEFNNTNKLPELVIISSKVFNDKKEYTGTRVWRMV